MILPYSHNSFHPTHIKQNVCINIQHLVLNLHIKYCWPIESIDTFMCLCGWLMINGWSNKLFQEFVKLSTAHSLLIEVQKFITILISSSALVFEGGMNYISWYRWWSHQNLNSISFSSIAPHLLPTLSCALTTTDSSEWVELHLQVACYAFNVLGYVGVKFFKGWPLSG